MILVGNQRAGAKDLALHLLKDENERVEVHELRGFASNDLISALRESQAISRGTRCKQHLYSLSLNPPKGAQVSVAAFLEAIEQAENRLGLSGQPRAVVFHEKFGSDGELRRHAHAVWCRIDTERMKAVQMSCDHRKLQTLSRELYLKHGWDLPKGHQNPLDRDSRNFSLAEWQQAKRAKEDPKALKAMFQECWTRSDSRASFSNALKERGYILSKGDRRGFVAADYRGEVYPVSR
ncbi:MAG: relaxase/mobilization nuclease domain-containing protein, partial [Oricola sp.]|nr:relaxase/mobilization nuclease domain-containing protein [Oricola sp.]